MEGKIRSGFAVRGVEDAVLGGVLVGPQVDMEGSFDGRNRALDLHIHPIARAADNRQAVRLCEGEHGVIVFLRGAKPRGELLRRKELPVGGAGRIVEIGQERRPGQPGRAAAERYPAASAGFQAGARISCACPLITASRTWRVFSDCAWPDKVPANRIAAMVNTNTPILLFTLPPVRTC